METYLFRIIEQISNKALMGLKPNFVILSKLRRKNLGPWILPKILVITKHKKLLFLYLSENSKNLSIGL